MEQKLMRTYNITKSLSNRLYEVSFYLRIPQSELVRDALIIYLYSPEICEEIIERKKEYENGNSRTS